ncbi:hypothetical protein NIES4075_63790 [Tolypothrix sp. NIES-4075]|uniref:hypothetical protein n=1 Tax=Tolypothrix sp. NIES-4075 TaxID=2005459 RepID=UPI000B6867B3|nr:hypothetical protein [Tolypothrix sp. NIES-4075]GAX45358.1 hypothetical protein NIES4075_63790 [Tolypothrix sp. NIES-4075]
MQSFNLDQTITAWSSIAENVFVPHTEEEYDRLVEMLDRLIDQVGEDESHPLASYDGSHRCRKLKTTKLNTFLS